MVSVATKEPKKLNVGDSWKWDKTLTDYPASTWTLTYYLRGPDGDVRSFAGSDDGNDTHEVRVAPATTDDYPPGRYTWVSRVSDGTDTYVVGQGFFDVAPDFSQANVDYRTHNQRCLEAIEAVRENRATTDQTSLAIEGRSLSRMSWAELEAQWLRFRDLVAKEQGKRVGRVGVRM